MKPETPYTGRTDSDLLRACCAGDTECFGELVLRHQDRVYTLALRLCGSADDAAEIAQEAFLKAYKAAATFRGDSAFYTWMYRITVNEFRSRRRFRAVRPAETSLEAGHSATNEDDSVCLKEHLSSNGPDPVEEAGRMERKGLVSIALGKLDEEQRAIIVLRDLDGRDYGEIAQILGCPRGTVKSRLHRARLALKELLSPTLKSEAEGLA